MKQKVIIALVVSIAIILFEPVANAVPTLTSGGFPNCRFNFGLSHRTDIIYDYSSVDYISLWIQPTFKRRHDTMLALCKQYNKVPVYVGYIIALLSRDMWGLKDCNVGEPNLCQKGAEFIRKYRDLIVSKYGTFANETAKRIGRNVEMVWLIEPDFYQYHHAPEQENGGISAPDMRLFYDDIARAIRTELPNAKISWDVKAYPSEDQMRLWWSYFETSPYIDFVHTGGQSTAASPHIKGNELTWSFINTLTGRRIIAQTGYGVGGADLGHTNAWDKPNNLNDRINDGVIAITQSYPADEDWASILNSVRPLLTPLCEI